MTNADAGRNKPNDDWRIRGICLLLALSVFIVFGQTTSFEFVNFDDNGYIYENSTVRSGLTVKGVVSAFTQFFDSNWHPLTTISHMAVWQFFGARAGAHHIINVLLHAANAVLLFLVLRRLTTKSPGREEVRNGTAVLPDNRTWLCAFVAGVFALHPLRVESVAWVTERKDVLSAFFFLLTLWCYAAYSERKKQPVVGESSRHSGSAGKHYALALLFFTLALISKPMIVTLPFVLLLLDFWPLQRLRGGGLGGERPSKLVLEKLPFFLLSAGSCMVTVLAQQVAIKGLHAISFSQRLSNALVSYATYLYQTFYPANLGAFYPFSTSHVPIAQVAVAGVMVAGISTLALALRKRQPWILVGWLWYLGMLVPVIGLVQAGDQSHADRYTYLPQIGIILFVTWTIAVASRRWKPIRSFPGLSAAGVLIILSLASYAQTGYWRDSKTMWTRALAVGGNSYIAHNNLASALVDLGENEEAIRQFQAALAIKSQDPVLYENLGTLLHKIGQLDSAIVNYQKASALNPNNAEVQRKLGDVFLQKGQLDQAITHFQNALVIKPGMPGVHDNLAIALAQSGRIDEAILHFQKAVAATPDSALAHNNLASAFAQRGRLEEAIVEFRAAVAAKPDYFDAQNNLANALLDSKRLGEAIPEFEKAARLQPQNVDLQCHAAWLLATCPTDSLRNGAKAVELAQRANQLSNGSHPMVLRTLAAAYAEAGRFPEAVETAQRALRSAGSLAGSPLSGAIQTEITSYRAGKAFRDSTLQPQR